MSDLKGWAKRKAAMRPGAGLVAVEVDVHTEHGVIRAIRYHRAEDAKKLIAEGKARELKDVSIPEKGKVSSISEKEKTPPPITGGSEKQNAWATQIAAKWVGQLDSEIKNAAARPKSDGVGWYVDKLRGAREVLVRGLAQMKARQVIDFEQSPHHGPVKTIIAKARQRE